MEHSPPERGRSRSRSRSRSRTEAGRRDGNTYVCPGQWRSVPDNNNRQSPIYSEFLSAGMFSFFVALAGLAAAIAAEEPSPTRARLAFGVMTYQKEGYSPNQTFTEFQRLMEHIYTSERHVYVFHVDIKSDPLLVEWIRGYCPVGASNCLFIEGRNVAWGGLSTGEMMLALMQDAYESVVAWDHFVLIGHESVPLTSLEYAEHHIGSFPLETNFIHCMDVEQIVVESYDADGNRLIEDIRTRRTVPWTKEMKFYKSIQLVVLSREFIRYLSYGRHTRRVMLYLANVKTSDEMLIPTLIQMNDTLAATATCDTTLHFTHWIRPGGSWHPEYLTLENLPQLMNTSELFARKFRAGTSDALLQAWNRIREEAYSAYENTAVNLLYRKSKVNAMDWLVPLIRSHVAAAAESVPRPAEGRRDEHANLRSVIRTELQAMGSLAEEENSETGHVTTHTPQEYLFALDRVRRARDLIETEKYFEYIRWRRQKEKDERARVGKGPKGKKEL